ncbi:MAG: sulfite exporter TauE/SafE family protein [Candidatus Latescibacteria bacterium]|nr:sulfite exporter TauE/SafE family protein [Candidatus Latescibacterota bacterium]
MLTLLAGLAAGLLHVFSGPDHLATVGTLAVEERRRPWTTGLVWGIGHTSGVWIVGALVLVLRAFLPLEQMASWSDRLASVGLIAIGVWGLYRGLAQRIHAHEHQHQGQVHRHYHSHSLAPEGEHTHAHVHTHLACGLGILHGLAGSSHFLGILPALALPTNTHALVYLSGFGLGTVGAMAGFGWFMGRISQRLAGRGAQAHRVLVTGCASAAILIGCVWLAA